MIYSVVINLQVKGAAVPGNVSGHHILSFFLNLIETGDAALAAELHRDSAVKPFTLSPLLPFHGRHSPVSAKIGKTLSFRVTLLEEKAFTSLADVVWRLPSEMELPLGNLRVQCQSMATTLVQSPWADFASFTQLIEKATASSKVRLTFLSPTTFRSKGRRNILFPEPSLVFGSLLNRWNAFTAADCQLELPGTTLGLVMISNYRLSTRVLDFGSYQELGFAGQATYECSDSLPEEHIRTLNTLADFAFYAGVGAKTTMGMGQCRRSDDASAISNRAGGDPEKRGRPPRRQQRGAGPK